MLFYYASFTGASGKKLCVFLDNFGRPVGILPQYWTFKTPTRSHRLPGRVKFDHLENLRGSKAFPPALLPRTLIHPLLALFWREIINLNCYARCRSRVERLDFYEAWFSYIFEKLYFPEVGLPYRIETNTKTVDSQGVHRWTSIEIPKKIWKRQRVKVDMDDFS